MERLQKRINSLLAERPEVIQAVAIAREFGDLSENAEYKAARERQRAIDGEIDSLRRRAATLKVVDTSALPSDIVRFGTLCKTQDEDSGEIIRYKLVGAHEQNFYEDEGDLQVISIISPIGKGLMGKRVEDTALVHAPMGDRKLKIIEIT